MKVNLEKMGMKNFSYFEPEKSKAALALLAEHKGRAKIFAGGTDLVPQMKRGLASPEVIINLSRIPGLREMKESPKGVKIGAMVPLGVLERSPTVASRYPGLKEAIRHVAVPAIRNAATIGGNVCLDTKCIYRDQVQTWERGMAPCFKMGGKRCYVVRGGKNCHASLAADTVPVLIALEAKARVLSVKGDKTIPIEALYTGNGIRPHALSPEEMVGEIFLPRPEKGSGSSYLRYSLRQAIDFPLVSVAVCLAKRDGICAGAKVVLGAVAPGPLRLAQAEAVLKGQKISEELLKECSRRAPGEALKISKSGRIDDFAKTMIANLVYQALKQAWPGKDLRGEE
jgi:4-hydroxybenzoyl-CoA reductase subunit beta